MHTSPLSAPGTGDAGGMNVYLSAIAGPLVDRGFEVDLITRRVDPSDPEIIELPSGARLLNLDAGPLAALTKGRLEAHVSAFAESMAHHTPYAVVHSHYWLSGVAGLALARATHTPHVVSLHTVAALKNATLAPGDEPEPERRVRWEHDLVHASALTIASTPAEAAAITGFYAPLPCHLEVITPGVDHAVFRATGPAADWLPSRLAGRPYLVMAARTQPLKGQDVAVRALAAMDPASRPALLLIGAATPGQEAYRDGLATLATELGIEDDVFFAAAVSREQLAAAFRGALALLVPSRSETFGLVTLEAAASGLPTIAARVGGLPDAVAQDRSGILVDGHDPHAWAQAITQLTTDIERLKTLSRTAVEYAAEFTWDRVADELAGHYRQLISANARAAAHDVLGDRVLVLHAHPDDETLSTGPLLAALSEAGVETHVLTATRGERGEARPGAVPAQSSLIYVRLAELATALCALGVSQHHWLGAGSARVPGSGPRTYTDSGMRWETAQLAAPAEGVSPDSLTSAPLDDVVADLLALIDEIDPTAIITYDSDGGYGHPDHIRVHEAGRVAAQRAGVPLFAIDNSNSDDPKITVGGEEYADQVRAALAAYGSQLELVEGLTVRHVGGQEQIIEPMVRLRPVPHD